MISLVMDVMIHHIGPAWTFRTLGLLTLSTALPAAWLIRERTPIQSDMFIEWYLSLTQLSHCLTLPLIYGLSDFWYTSLDSQIPFHVLFHTIFLYTAFHITLSDTLSHTLTKHPANMKTLLTYLYSYRRLFCNYKFVTIFLVGIIATFPLLVPFIFIPLYSSSLHLSSNAGAALVAAYNISSAIGRLTAGIAGDLLGPLNTLLIVLFFTTISIFVIWPLSNSLGPMVLFVIINGASNGGFFATIPTVVGSEFGSQRVSVAMGMIVTGWIGGYLLVCLSKHLPTTYIPPVKERWQQD